MLTNRQRYNEELNKQEKHFNSLKTHLSFKGINKNIYRHSIPNVFKNC